jgi:hypothetical protein
VEPMGFEPTTSSMPSRRAPNCATAPPESYLYNASIEARDSSRFTSVPLSGMVCCPA